MIDKLSARQAVEAEFETIDVGRCGADDAFQLVWLTVRERMAELVKEREREALDEVVKLLDQEALKRGGRMSARGLILQQLREEVKKLAEETRGGQ